MFPKQSHKYFRRIIHKEIVTSKSIISVWNSNKRKRMCKKYKFFLECGHTVFQQAQGAGHKPMKKKSVYCQFCEEIDIYGEV